MQKPRLFLKNTITDTTTNKQKHLIKETDLPENMTK